MTTATPTEAQPASRPSRRAAAAAVLARVLLQEDINFLLTNRIPRRYATLFMGWWSRIEIPWVAKASLATFRFFADDLELHDARETTFTSLHACFVRELREGARRIDRDPTVVVSPCDAIVGACGLIDGTRVFQAKGFPYTLEDLLADERLAEKHRGGAFVTLRLKANMYHRFHAPCAGRLRAVRYVSGDTWNVNPIALARVERLFCKNERAVLDIEEAGYGQAITLVPVAAILVASIRLHALSRPLDLRYRGPNVIPCDAAFEKGDELGYFESGSTIVVFATGGLTLCDGVSPGARIRMGAPLLHGLRPGSRTSPARATNHDTTGDPA
jgi:phosphatidylserine decarboxylase